MATRNPGNLLFIASRKHDGALGISTPCRELLQFPACCCTMLAWVRTIAPTGGVLRMLR